MTDTFDDDNAGSRGRTDVSMMPILILLNLLSKGDADVWLQDSAYRRA